MNINRINNTTRPQQRHNKNQVCCELLQQLKSLLRICCVCNFLFHCKLTPFHNKTTKIKQYDT
jgi:hypothetical protein